jgi:putative ABC transport system permease protein
MQFQIFIENIKISLEAIRSHILRTILTVLIIAFGIMALVGISTAINALESSLAENLQMMGSNTFTIRNRSMQIQVGANIHKAKYYEPIRYRQAMDFSKSYEYPATVSVFTYATWGATIRNRSLATNPNIAVIGTDENYFATSGLELQKGRAFSNHEMAMGTNLVVIGFEVAKNLFVNKENPLDKFITVGPGRYRVIGVIKEKGTGMGFTSDRQAFIPITNARHFFYRPNMTYNINVMPAEITNIDDAIGEATGLFRIIRQNKLYEENDFDISKSDQLLQMLNENTKNIKVAALIIGLITLLGAAIGLMNIMLVSVTERTREIGIRKSLGATRLNIRNQFLVESILIGQMGGILGIIFGILAGNLVTIFTESSFIIPWAWILIGISLCFGVALLSGIIPAIKAANLDPIESLRYE